MTDIGASQPDGAGRVSKFFHAVGAGRVCGLLAGVFSDRHGEPGRPIAVKSVNCESPRCSRHSRRHGIGPLARHPGHHRKFLAHKRKETITLAGSAGGAAVFRPSPLSRTGLAQPPLIAAADRRRHRGQGQNAAAEASFTRHTIYSSTTCMPIAPAAAVAVEPRIDTSRVCGPAAPSPCGAGR